MKNKENRPNVTVFNEGNIRTNGNSPKPTNPKPNVQPSGQQIAKTSSNTKK